MKRRSIPATIVILLSMLTAFPACGVLDEDTDNCPQGCRIELSAAGVEKGNVYSALRLSSDLEKLTLWIFDQNGSFVERTEVTGSTIKENGYSFHLPLDPGDYQIVAWIGAESTQYTLPTLTRGSSGVDDLTLLLERNSDDTYGNRLTPLWHGYRNNIRIVSGTETRVELPMTKDTNTFIAVVQDSSGADITSDDFSVQVLADNGFMGYDNRLLADDRITYNAYLQQSATVDSGEEGESTPLSVLRAEMSTLRLMTDKAVRFIITDNRTQQKILDINLIQYLLLTRELAEGSIGSKLTDQDYLDFQDTYSIVFFLTPTGKPDRPYACLTLNINGWIVRLNGGII